MLTLKVTVKSTSTAIVTAVTASTGTNHSSTPSRHNSVGLGAGLGLGLGIPLLLGCIALGYCVGRRKRSATNITLATGPPGSSGRRPEKMDIPIGGLGSRGPRHETDNDRDIHETDSLYSA